MSLNDMYRLPKSILIDVALMRKCPNSTTKDHMRLIKMRYIGKDIKLIETNRQGKIGEITLKDIDEYNEIQEQPKTVIVPTSKIEYYKSRPQYIKIDDDSIVADYRDRAKLLDYLKKQAVERIIKIKDVQENNLVPQLEAVIALYIKAAVDIVEKEDKMKIALRDESKTKKIIKERVDMVLIPIIRVLKEHISDKMLLKKIFRDLKNTFVLWKIKQNIGD